MVVENCCKRTFIGDFNCCILHVFNDVGLVRSDVVVVETSLGYQASLIDVYQYTCVDSMC